MRFKEEKGVIPIWSALALVFFCNLTYLLWTSESGGLDNFTGYADWAKDLDEGETNWLMFITAVLMIMFVIIENTKCSN